MKVTCEKCGTEYNFDDAKVTEEGVKVKCTRCEHVFRVRKRAFTITEPASGVGGDPGKEESSPGISLPGTEPSARRWTIRKYDGSQVEFNEMTTLQRWIVERKVSREDEISHNGVKWKRLGTIPELGAFFDVVGGPTAEDEDKTSPAMAAVRLDAAERADRGAQPAPKKSRGAAIAGLLVLALLAAGGGWAQLSESGLAATSPAREWIFASTGLDLRSHAAATPAATPSPTVSAVAQTSPSAAPSVTPAETAVAVATTVPPTPTSAPSAAATTAVAVATATPAATRAPKASIEQLLNQGYELYSRGKYREAIKKYQAAVDTDQNNSEAWALLGLAYLDDGQDELAESCLQSSVRLNSRFADSHRYLGLLYSRRGDKTKAVAEFNTYLDLRPTGPTSDDVRKRVASLEGG